MYKDIYVVIILMNHRNNLQTTQTCAIYRSVKLH